MTTCICVYTLEVCTLYWDTDLSEKIKRTTL